MEPTVRLATEADAEEISDIYAPVVEETHISFETIPPTNREMVQRIQETTKQLPWLVCEYDGQVVGYTYASPHENRPAYQWSVDVSVYVDEEWRRRGIARGLYESLFALLREQGLYTAYAVIALPNPPSVTFHKSFGFERIGVYQRVGYKCGEWRDVGHWQLSLQEHENPPSSPTPLDKLRGTDRYKNGIATGKSSIRL